MKVNLSRFVYRIGTHMSLHILTSEHSKYSVIDSGGENAQWLIYIHLVNTLIGQEKIHLLSKQGRDGNLHAGSALNEPIEKISFCSSSLGKDCYPWKQMTPNLYKTQQIPFCGICTYKIISLPRIQFGVLNITLLI